MSLYYDSDDVQLHHGDALEVARTLLNRDYLRMSLETRFLQPSLPWEAL